MQWTSVLSRAQQTDEALTEAIASIRAELEAAPDFLAVFSSRHHERRQAEIPGALRHAFGGAVVTGCAAHSVIGGREEEENQPALSVTAATLPDVDLHVHHVDTSSGADWIDHIEGDPQAIMVIVDAFSTDAETLLRALDQKFPGVPKFGGFASGGVYPGSNALYSAGQALRHGSLVVTFSGAIEVDTIVAQGCRPIGTPRTVTRHRPNMVLALDGDRPTDVLQALYKTLPAQDRALIPESLHVGIEMKQRSDQVYRRGDFLVRPLAGLDPNSGALTIGGRLRGKEIVQFHLRDARASTEDLGEWLDQYEGDPGRVRGALLFSCVARGVDLFGVPNHDTGLFGQTFGDVPVGGFFCSREIGPVNEETYVHGYTSTFALFRTPED